MDTAAGLEKSAWLRALSWTAPFARGDGLPLPAMIAAIAATAPDRPALLGDDGCLTYRDLVRRIDAYARWALRHGIEPGDTVAILLPNCADYVALWLGIISVRGVAALVNTGLSGDALLHVLGAARARHVVVGGACEAAAEEITGRLPHDLLVWGHGETAHRPRIDAALDFTPFAPGERPAPSLTDLALYIYTSGTTGRPKAARVSHRRVGEWACWFAGMIDTQPDDRMYNCLPLFHSTGGVVAVGAMLVAGGSVLIRPRFSATRFWDEVVENDCTLFQYIGELCRYLAASPPHPRESAHHLRLCCGNGLRGDVWERFRERFAIPRILEFYAATESNISLYNVPGRPGAIGHVPGFLKHRFPMALVRCDLETRILARGSDGMCILCGSDEPGEALGRISASEAPGRPFEGYSDSDASAAKIARDVLVQGDAWFRTGDLMRRDRDGYYYFVERLGDTFRWKGENVSTEEVAAALRACPGVRDASVYGVHVPGTEGRAGMAAIVAGPDFELASLNKNISGKLPEYARPVFLRFLAEMSATATFKPATGTLSAEGFDPEQVADPLYVGAHGAGNYLRLDRPLYDRILSGDLRL